MGSKVFNQNLDHPRISSKPITYGLKMVELSNSAG